MAKAEICVDHEGRTFTSKSEMCKHWGISTGYLNRKLSLGIPLKEILEYGKNRFIIDPYENKFKSYKELCDHHGFKYEAFMHAVRSGKTLEEIFANGGTISSACFDHRGKRFNNESEMCKTYGISQCTFQQRIRQGWSLQRALETPVSKLNKVCKDHLENTYDSIEDMCNKYGISYSTFRSRRKAGMSLEEALTTPSMGKGRVTISIDAFGMHFDSLNKARKYFDLPNKLFEYRLSRGNSEIEVALIVPANDKRSIDLKYIGLDGKAYYRVGWSDKYITARDIIQYYRPDLLEAYDKSNPEGSYRPYEG